MKPLNPSSIHRMVIRTPNWVGDAVMSTPFLRAVRKNFPHTHITLLAKPWVAPVYANNPHIDHIIIYDDAGRHRGLIGKFRLAKDLRKYNFDLALLLQNAFEAAFLVWMAAIPIRLGYDTDVRKILLTHPIHRYPSLKRLHQIDYYLEILKGTKLIANSSELEIFISDEEKRQAIQLIRTSGCPDRACIIGINPGAAFGTAKRWFPNRFAELCNRLKSIPDVCFLIFGGPGEEELGKTIAKSVGDACINLCGKTTLRQAISLIDQCRLFITNDSGLMHLAAALHKPQIAIFGSTDYATTSPGSHLSHIIRAPVACSPCMKPDCPTDHQCMDAITVDHVLGLVLELLSGGQVQPLYETELPDRSLMHGHHHCQSRPWSCPGTSIQQSVIMNILIVKLSAIGDVIHTLPALNAIRSAYPSAHITWLIEEAAAPLIIGHSALDRVIISRRKSWIRDIRNGQWKSVIREATGLVRTIRDTAYDLVFDFQALLKSGVLVTLCRGKRKIGFNRGMEHQEHSYLFLNERVKPVDMNHHAILRNLMMLDAAEIHSSSITYQLPIHAVDRKAIKRLLAKEVARAFRSGFSKEPGPDTPATSWIKDVRPLICINPVAKWTTKLWPNERFAELADRLSERYRIFPVFTGAPEDKETVQDILSRMRSSAIDMTGKTSLKTLAALYETADILISTDTGPMHLGAAVNTPVVALFGPTAPWRTGPMGDKHQVIRAGLPCSPCFKRQCSTCDCMTHISVDQVLEGVARVMTAGGL